MGNPKGKTGTWVHAKGGNGRDNGHGNGIRRRHTVLGSEMSDRIWWVMGVGNVQVNSALLREIMWGAGVTER